jgi:hypothetical protein
MTWCSTSNRILLAGVGESGVADFTCVYEVEIPANLVPNDTRPWPMTKVTLPGGKQLPAGVAYGANCWKRWHYDERIKGIFFYASGGDGTTDTAYIYRPRNT